MSDDASQKPASDEKSGAVQTPEKPAPEKKEEPKKEIPFNTDKLKQCTSRFSRDAWNIFLVYDKEKSLEKMQNQPVAFRMTARSEDDARIIRTKLEKELNLSGITGKGPTVEFTATFAQLQSIIKEPETYKIDATRLDA